MDMLDHYNRPFMDDLFDSEWYMPICSRNDVNRPYALYASIAFQVANLHASTWQTMVGCEDDALVIPRISKLDQSGVRFCCATFALMVFVELGLSLAITLLSTFPDQSCID